MATVNATRPPLPKATFRVVLTESEALAVLGALGKQRYGGPTTGTFNAFTQEFDALGIDYINQPAYLEANRD